MLMSHEMEVFQQEGQNKLFKLTLIRLGEAALTDRTTMTVYKLHVKLRELQVPGSVANGPAADCACETTVFYIGVWLFCW